MVNLVSTLFSKTDKTDKNAKNEKIEAGCKLAAGLCDLFEELRKSRTQSCDNTQLASYQQAMQNAYAHEQRMAQILNNPEYFSQWKAAVKMGYQGDFYAFAKNAASSVKYESQTTTKTTTSTTTKNNPLEVNGLKLRPWETSNNTQST